MPNVLLTGTTDASTIEGLLNLAGQVVTWLISTMGQFLKFMTDNPIILIGLILTFVGLGVGMLTRIIRTV